ncbi:capsule biosynthesis protein [Phenylobacterium montanum]|uniref:Capsular biosynthesis protein n=1 Tax=Phenylobacterium montanum TaxID=2823693 RepID=A0A975G247_9CAUL|nr:capsular biosynthesis protein [Caulobacter sp. S6]QUD89097.1 capsular biosynthesis protein [Caulobacter sp. S6]
MTDRRKRFLFLQGLPGGSFWRLAVALRERGCFVIRVNFNGGDQMDWPEPAIGYRGPLSEWPATLNRIVEQHGVTDIVLFGDCRPLHRAALSCAGASSLTVHVFEEGYVRPDWVTLEQGGVNGHSTLPRDPDWYLREAAALAPVVIGSPLGQTFDRRARETFGYHAAAILLWWRYPFYRTHRPWGALTEGRGWLVRLARRSLSKRRTVEALSRIAERRYFLFALQLDSDYQIRVHSSFAGMMPAIDFVMRSFALHAPPDACLVVKEHPLDNGLKDWRGLVRQSARLYGVADRVVFCDLGDIDVLVRGSAGLVTVNSTTGTLGLSAGVPVVAMGRAVYDMPGLTHQTGLDAFWTDPQQPSVELYEAFRRVLADRCMVRGGFYSEEGLSLLIDGAVERILARSKSITSPSSLAVAAE